MRPRPLRIAYALEFFLAVVAFFECWSQVAGQAPLDIMPWWLKLLFATGFSYVAVMFTAAMVRNEAFPPVTLMRWGLVMLIVVIVITLTTSYYQRFVPPDQDSDEPASTAWILGVSSASC